MENRAEDEIRKRWEVEAAERRREEEEGGRVRPKKRVRAIEYTNDDGEFVLGAKKKTGLTARPDTSSMTRSNS